MRSRHVREPEWTGGGGDDPSAGGERPGPADRALLEFQIHPQDIRKKVRYLFLSRREVAWWAVAAGALVALVVSAVILTPRVVADLWRTREYNALLAERKHQKERLGSLVQSLDKLRAQSADLRLVIDKVYLLYGLSSDPAGGQGGYPFVGDAKGLTAKSDPLAYGKRLKASIVEQLSVTGIFLHEIQDFEVARQDQVRQTPSISPLRGGDYVLTSPFGDRRNPFTQRHDFHAGLDLAAPIGTPIHAPADGVVLFAGRYSLQRSVGWWRYGNLVILGHGDHFRTLFGHCSKILVKRGQRVSQGDVIAQVGSTGMSTSSHLHYEVRREDGGGVFRPVDPRIYILDHRWRNEEQLLVRSRTAPPATDFQPLPPLAGR